MKKAAGPPVVHPPKEIAEIIDRVSEGDRRYFEEHPHENIRVRPPVEGEFWPVKMTSVFEVVVVQVWPGYRHRYPVVRLSLPSGNWLQ